MCVYLLITKWCEKFEFRNRSQTLAIMSVTMGYGARGSTRVRTRDFTDYKSSCSTC